MDPWVYTIMRTISVDDLPEGYRQVASIVGVENALKLSEHLGGLPYYFPQLDGLLRKKRDEAIRHEFTGSNYRDLAKKYRLTERWIREIVDNSPTHNQSPLF